MGAPRKPNHLKAISGTARPDRAVTEVELPKAEGDEPPPGWLSTPDAITEWKRLYPILSNAGLLASADLSFLAVLCETYGQIVDNAKRRNPVTGHLLAQYRAMCGDMGITAAARGKVNVNGRKPEANQFANNGKRPQRGTAPG